MYFSFSPGRNERRKCAFTLFLCIMDREIIQFQDACRRKWLSRMNGAKTKKQKRKWRIPFRLPLVSCLRRDNALLYRADNTFRSNFPRYCNPARRKNGETTVVKSFLFSRYVNTYPARLLASSGHVKGTKRDVYCLLGCCCLRACKNEGKLVNRVTPLNICVSAKRATRRMIHFPRALYADTTEEFCERNTTGRINSWTTVERARERSTCACIFYETNIKIRCSKRHLCCSELMRQKKRRNKFQDTAIIK